MTWKIDGLWNVHCLLREYNNIDFYEIEGAHGFILKVFSKAIQQRQYKVRTAGEAFAASIFVSRSRQKKIDLSEFFTVGTGFIKFHLYKAK